MLWVQAAIVPFFPRFIDGAWCGVVDCTWWLSNEIINVQRQGWKIIILNTPCPPQYNCSIVFFQKHLRSIWNCFFVAAAVNTWCSSPCFQEKELKVQVLSSRDLCSEFTPATGRHSIMEIKCRTELCTPFLSESKGSFLRACGGEEENNFWFYSTDEGC